MNDITTMTDWVYRDRLIIHNGELIEFKQNHADVINLLLIAEGRISNIDLFNLLYPKKAFCIAGSQQIAGMIVKINKVFAGFGWEIMQGKRHFWIECGVAA